MPLWPSLLLRGAVRVFGAYLPISVSLPLLASKTIVQGRVLMTSNGICLRRRRPNNQPQGRRNYKHAMLVTGTPADFWSMVNGLRLG